MNTTIVVIMSTPNFRFKQFTIQHDKCAMKVGTDGVLLGAWAQPNYVPSGHLPCTILDVGTGSGLIARMLMQRFPNATVEGIDIDPMAVEQAQENGVTAFQSDLQHWQTENKGYDLIVSNPPYFQNSLKNPDFSRQTARHTDTLSYSDLMFHCARLLAPEGELALILPVEAETEIQNLAQQNGLLLVRLTRVFSKESKPARRLLLAFVKSETTGSRLPIIEDTLVLEDEHGGRSADYQKLTKDFYL